MDRDGAGDKREGIVIRSQSGFCTVLCDGREYLCQLRGRLKQGKRRSHTVAVAGDRVAFRPVADAGSDTRSGVVEEVLPRANKISRTSSRRDSGRTEQVLMANLDQIVVVQSVCQPAPMSGFVDRLLAASARYGVAGLLCVNKIDLDAAAAGDARWDYYATIGYCLLRTSAETGDGVDAFHDALLGRITLLLGASGTGKSALLARATGLDLEIGDVTEKTGLGRHTTTRTELFPIGDGGFIADSPGIRGFEPWDVEPVELRTLFPDFLTPAGDCRFATCVHRDEPGCGIKRAVRDGELPAWRHEAYLLILGALETREAERGPRRRKKE
ncbi:ribosome small subunit-dependent GTPase A [bacterium]|nr:ribosome small subunit-dependent GTPase A [bacterium]MBU1071808.1 ribosome small subunit-dependent GTPase A [bacterium]MBU1674529.1 ribosome small subunit-dependent GTPase A [bacterium]